jgi:1,5-anhydro-D-fructose reductase (1,5-anhydro-D-mannitol-forming)
MSGWALIGTGQQARNEMVPALAASGARLVACVGTSTEKAEEVAAPAGGYGTADLGRALADPEVEAVYVGSPNALHVEHVDAALRAGKHVLCDKPLAIEAGEAGALVALARERDLRLGLVHQLRHHPAHDHARALIAAGEVGEVLAIRVDYGSPSRLSGWRTDRSRAGGGVLFNVGVHLIDLVRHLTGAEITQVVGQTEPDPESGLDVSLSALLGLDTGGTAPATASVWCSHRATAQARTVLVHGTQASVEIRDSLRLTGTPGPSSVVLRNADGEGVHTFPATPIMHRQVASFEAAIRDGGAPRPDGDDGLAGVLVAQALLASAAASAAVRLPADRP